MIKHKWIGSISVLLMMAALLLTGYMYMNPSALASFTKTTKPAYTSVLDKTNILSLQIIADENDWLQMLANATAEEYIQATVFIDGVKVENVGVRPKGNSSLSMVAADSTSNRFSFKIEFDHYISGQTWLGLDKLAVNNMQGDASYMKEYLSYDIMSYVDVASPLVAFADVTVNGETWGFYLAVECLEESYAERVFGKNYGMLYKPESMGMRGAGRMNEFIQEMEGGALFSQAQSQPGPGVPGQGRGNREGGFGGGMGMSFGGVSLQYSGDTASDYSAIFDNAIFKANETDYQRVIRALEKLSNGEDLEQVIDVEAVLRYFAAHTVVVNLDSYISGMGHNYYLYEKNGRLSILPWDYNLAFGGFQAGSASAVVNFPVDTPVSGVSLSDRPLLGKLLEVPAYQEMYHRYLEDILQGYFNNGHFEQTIASLNALIAPYVANDPTAFYSYEAYQEAVVELIKLGLLRSQSIAGQLEGTVPSTSAEQSAYPEKLIDASEVNLMVLGSQGGGGGMFGGAEFGGFGAEGSGPGRSAPGGLTAEEMSALGLEAEDNMRGIRRQAMPAGGRSPEGFTGGGSANIPGGQMPGEGTAQFVAAAGPDVNTWIMAGGSVLLFLISLWFVCTYKRRRF